MHRFEKRRERSALAKAVDGAAQSLARGAEHFPHPHQRVLLRVGFVGAAFADEAEVVAAEHPDLA